MARRDAEARRDNEEKGRNDRNAANIDSHEKIAGSKPGATNKKRPYVGLMRNGKPVPGLIDSEGEITEPELPEGSGFDPSAARPERPPTEKQTMFAFYGDAANSDLPLIEELEAKYKPGWTYEVGQTMPNFVGRHVTSENDKRYSGAMVRFLDNVLHAATGAGFNETEVIGKMKGFSIQPGDPESAIADKHKARRRYVQFILDVAAGKKRKDIDMPPEFKPQESIAEQLARANAEKARRVEAQRGGQQ
jgi:hypothetical protein